MKDKKKLGTALNSIISSLRKAYDLINTNTDLPDIEDEQLPSIANILVKTLIRDLTELKENERFEGMSEEEVHETKESERADRIAKLQEQSAEEFKKMCGIRDPEPAQDPEPESDEDPEGDQDPDSTEDQEEETHPDPQDGDHQDSIPEGHQDSALGAQTDPVVEGHQGQAPEVQPDQVPGTSQTV